MKMSEALEIVSQAYVPGVEKFYCNQTPNPWQKAHDTLEKCIDLDDDMKEVGAEVFAKKCLDLIREFKKKNPGRNTLSMGDHFYITNEQKLRELQSVRGKVCYQCESKKDLTIEPVPGSDKAVKLVCLVCKTNKGGKK